MIFNSFELQKNPKMNIKTLFAALMLIFFVSCSKEKASIIEPSLTKTVATQATSTQVSSNTEQNFKAYIFIERQSRTTQIVNYLKTLPRHPLSSGTPFYACNTMVSIQTRTVNDLQNYLNMPLWTNGVLPQVIQTEVPQVSGGTDSYGNPITAYNFTTIKIPKNTINENAWVLVLIPVSAMNNDTKRQNRIAYYARNATRIVSSANNTQTAINTNTQLSSYLINYTGSIIPQGLYRVYSTYNNPGMRIGFTSTADFYLRGLSN
jgi:hypothetical protein